MKRRNADTGKMRRPLKRTKITEGMYGNSFLYLKFVMLWATVVIADYMLEFRFEFLWPFWMMLRSVYDSFKYQGIAFSVFFMCIALTSDMICFFFIPLQYIFFAASTYVWVQYVWYTFADKGICLPTVAICCAVVYLEGTLRSARELELCRPLAAHCVGYPAVSLGFGVKAYVGRRLRLRRQRQVRAENEFYFQLMRDALPESALEQNTKEERAVANGIAECSAIDSRQLNGSLRRRCVRENGLCGPEHTQLQVKLEKLEKHLAQQTAAREREKPSKSQPSAQTNLPSTPSLPNAHTHANSSAVTLVSTFAHSLTNGSAGGAGAMQDEERHEHNKGSVKSSKCEKKEASILKEERKKHKNKDKDKEKESNGSHKSTEQIKEQIVKEVESTKENVKSNKDSSSSKEKDKEKERDKEREREMKEKEKEREREREREQRWAKECGEELKRARAELAIARSGEAEARRALAASAASERQKRAEHAQLRQAHAALQNKMSTWRSTERAVLERRLSEERRARASAEQQLQRARTAARTPSGECENEWCKSRRTTQEAEAATLRNELLQTRNVVSQLQRELQQAADQVRVLEARREENCSPTLRLAEAWQALQERAAHLEQSLSSETRVKLDLLSALGDAKRQLRIHEGVISRQEKELEELKAQMLAVMPVEFVGPVSGAVSKLRLCDGSPLDPNASVYTPKQLMSDA